MREAEVVEAVTQKNCATTQMKRSASDQFWREAARTVLGVKTIEVDALTDQGNYAVIRLPERKFPGVVVQGDSLSILISNLRRSRDQLLRQAGKANGRPESLTQGADLSHLGFRRSASRCVGSDRPSGPRDLC